MSAVNPRGFGFAIMGKDKKASVGATSAQLAELFDCTTRQIELWAQEKIVVRVSRGSYDARRSTTNLVRHLREQAAGRAGLDPSSDTAAAKAEKDKAQTRLTDLRYRKLAGEVVDVAAARDAWGRVMRYLRGFVLGLPGKIHAAVPTLSPHDKKAIERICREGLQDAALGRGLDLTDANRDDADVSD